MFIPHAQAGKGYVPVPGLWLHYLVASSKSNKIWREVCEISSYVGWREEGRGDYITCGTCDVMSGRHTGEWCLTNFEALPCPMFGR